MRLVVGLVAASGRLNGVGWPLGLRVALGLPSQVEIEPWIAVVTPKKDDDDSLSSWRRRGVPTVHAVASSPMGGDGWPLGSHLSQDEWRPTAVARDAALNDESLFGRLQ